ncbi:MAG TPA: class I SAM-dependent methyltransferase [Nocardioides sp.]
MSREQWDSEAATYDEEPDHGLTDPTLREAWRQLLGGVLPTPPAHIADLGCGTGTLARLLVDEGYSVDGLDFSPEMLARARVKVPEATFVAGDASTPALKEGTYDVVLSRHVLWALPDPKTSFARWVKLLRPGGIVVLVEGDWSTGAGLSAAEAEEIVRSVRRDVSVQRLSEEIYWGKVIDDERYLLISRS